MVGPRPDSHGGVAATVRMMHRSQLESDFRLVQVSTYRDGPTVLKARQATRGLASLTRLCVTGRVDLAHIHITSGASLARKAVAVAIAVANRVPVVLHVHAHSGALFNGSTSVLSRSQRHVFRWTLESADTVVALTPAWERRLAERGRIRRSRVVANVPDIPLPAKPRSSTHKSLILFLGHLYRHKGVYELLEAFTRLKVERPDLKLVLAGEGPEAQDLSLRAKQLGVKGAVQLPGWVDTAEKEALLAEAACLVLPSFSEGLPLVLLEAMHAGVPVVATTVGGIPETVEDSREALLVHPNDVSALSDALARLVDDQAFAASLGENARARALTEFTPGVFAVRIGDIYREVLSGR